MPPWQGLVFKFACRSPTAFLSSKQHKQEDFGCYTADEDFWHVSGKPCGETLQFFIWNETTGAGDHVSIQSKEECSSLLCMPLMAVGGMWKHHSSILSARSYMKIPSYNRMPTEWQLMDNLMCRNKWLEARYSKIFPFPHISLKEHEKSCRVIFYTHMCVCGKISARKTENYWGPLFWMDKETRSHSTWLLKEEFLVRILSGNYKWKTKNPGAAAAFAVRESSESGNNFWTDWRQEIRYF